MMAVTHVYILDQDSPLVTALQFVHPPTWSDSSFTREPAAQRKTQHGSTQQLRRQARRHDG